MTFNPTLESIKRYEAGKPIELVVRDFGIQPDQIIKLASNENPFGCSLKVQEAVRGIVTNMALYPDDSMFELKAALARRFAVSEANLVVGAGSDQVIEFAVHAKAHAGAKVLMNSVTFAMYEIYARHVGAEIIRTESRHHDFEAFYALYEAHRPAIIFICTPNNPTGDAVDVKALERFLQRIDSDTLVVIDGAYMEYAIHKDKTKAVDPAALIRAFPNVLYLGTFSKAYGLGGMRVGYGIADAAIITALSKLRPPFNITTLSLKAATVALEDTAFVEESIVHNFEEMARYDAFAKGHGLETIESYTNFITLCFEAPRDSTKIADALLRQGMIVRDLAGYGLNAIRVTIGKTEQNDRLFILLGKQL